MDNNHQGSLSYVLSRKITSMDISSSEYDDTINMALFKLSKSTDSSETLKLNYSIREKYNWSFNKERLKSVSTSTRPVSAFVENVVENSNNISIMMNPFIANATFNDIDGSSNGKIRIFSDKILSNLENYERKYICNNMADTTNSKKNISAMVPATIAKSSINSWATMVKQVGLTPHFIKTQLANYNYYTSFLQKCQ